MKRSISHWTAFFLSTASPNDSGHTDGLVLRPTAERPAFPEVDIQNRLDAPDDPSPRLRPGDPGRRKMATSLPQSATLPGVSVTDIRLPWAPSPPQTPPLYRAFKGNSLASSLKADDLEHLSQRNGANLAFNRREPRTSVDLAVQQSEGAQGKQLRSLNTPCISRVRSDRFGPGSVSVGRLHALL